MARIGIGERGQLHLPHQVILQRLGGFALINRQLIVLVVCTRTGRGAGGINFIPAGIQRKLVRHLFLFECICGIERFCILGLLCIYLIMKIGLLQQGIAVQRLLELLLEFLRWTVATDELPAVTGGVIASCWLKLNCKPCFMFRAFFSGSALRYLYPIRV